MGSVVLALALGRPPLVQLMVVAFADAALSTVALIAERGLLPEVVATEALPDAVAANEARMALSSIGGPPLGGALYGLARGLPFAGRRGLVPGRRRWPRSPCACARADRRGPSAESSVVAEVWEGMSVAVGASRSCATARCSTPPPT